MAVQKVEYYFVQCDGCGADFPYEDGDALQDRIAGNAEDQVKEAGWTVEVEDEVEYTTVYCPSCQA